MSRFKNKNIDLRDLREPALLCFVLFLLIIVPASCLLAQSKTGSRPNIILFIADDIGWNDIGCYGNRQIKTPHIDRIAEQGIRFNNFYLTTSSCSPSRCSIIAGRYPHNTGAAELHTPLPSSITTFPQLLKASGYYTAQAGKWHLGESPRAGFDIIHDNTKENGDGGELLWVSTLQDRPKDQPFFCWFAPYDSHRPWGVNEFSGTNDPGKMIPPVYMANAPATRQDLAKYADETSRFDFYVGEVEKELKKQGVLENTIILIMSDNGSPFPRAKTRVYDSGMKTFFIVRWDKGRLKKNTVSKSLISAVDIAPTLLELAGSKPAGSFQGKSFAAILKQPSAAFRNYIFSEHNWHDYEAAERMVRTDDYLYCLNLRPALSNPGPADVTSSPSFDDLKILRDQNKLTPAQSDVFLQPRPVEELYDCRKDPLQLHNLAADPAYKEILIRLRKTMEQWRNETGDTVPDELTKDWFDRENGTALPGKKIRGEMPGGSRALILNAGGPF